MTLHHSEETHQNLVARVAGSTGRGLPEWYQELESGPGLNRFEDRVNWLRDEHGLSHGQATAIVHEHDKLRASRKR
jgi:hypothetical protein